VTTNDDSHEEIHDENNEHKESLSSLFDALTEHHQSTPYQSPFTLKPTSDNAYVSHSEDKGLSSDEVGRFLETDRLPWGIDWMDLSFPIRSLVTEPPYPWHEMQSNGANWSHKWVATFEIGYGSVELSVKKRGNALSGYLMFNPTTCMYGPKSLYVSRLDDAIDVTHLVLDAVNEWVVPGCERNDMFLSRLDVSTTVEPVADMQRTLSIIKNASGRGTTPRTSYDNDGKIQTVIRRSKRAGGYCVYDKGLQAGLDVSALRVEVTARRARLRDLCSHLGDLDETRLRQIAMKSLTRVIDNLRLEPRKAVTDILAVQKEAKSLIEMVGLATLADLGHFPPMSKYAWTTKYLPVLRKFSARTVGDLLN